MAKKTKKASWLYIALGAVVGLGAVMGISRLVSKDDEPSYPGTTLMDTERFKGGSIVLAYDDADKILDICRSAMENSNVRAVETGYTYFTAVGYADTEESYVYVEIFYDYSEDSKEDVLFVSHDGETIFKVDESGISGKRYTFSYLYEDHEWFYDYSITGKLQFGERSWLEADRIEVDVYNVLPVEIINLVRLVEGKGEVVAH